MARRRAALEARALQGLVPVVWVARQSGNDLVARPYTASFQAGLKGWSQFADRHIVSAQPHTGSKPPASVAAGRVPPNTIKGITMTTSNTSNTSNRRLRALLRAAACLAVAVTLGGLATGEVAIANAKPSKQSVNAFVDCINARAQLNGGSATHGDVFDCCINAGGAWNGGNFPAGHCDLPQAGLGAPASDLPSSLPLPPGEVVEGAPAPPPPSRVAPLPPGSANIN